MNYFSEEETQCKCGCGGDISDKMRYFLNAIRTEVNHPMVISSGFRCVTYDKSIGGKGVHPTGLAADVLCSGSLSYAILRAAFSNGATGVGVSQKGEHTRRFLHLDLTDGVTRPWVWSY